jgi:hypothetical protein
MSTKVFAQSTNPTFLLRKIDPFLIYKRYTEGFYVNTILKKAEEINIKKADVNIKTFGKKFENTYSNPYTQQISNTTQHLPSTSDHEIYTLRGNTDNPITMVTLGHSVYDIFTKNGGVLPKGGICEWDNHPFDHEIIGIPIKFERITTVLPNQSSDSVELVETVRYVFHVDGTFCSFECAFAFLMKNLGLPSRHKSVKYMDSEQMLHYMFQIVHPDKGNLKESPTYRLIKPRGPLTIEEFRSKNNKYMDTNLIILAPIKDIVIKR